MALLGNIFTKDKKPARKAEKDQRAAREGAPIETPLVSEHVRAVRPSAATSLLLHPHTTEKTALLANTGAYVFAVAKDANKHTVALAVRARYGVKVERVRITRTHEKMRRRGRQIGWKPGIKKAIVQLASGHKIETL